MKKLDKFILKSFLGPFVLIFAIVVFILALQFLWVYIDELVGKGLSIWVIIEFLAWASATILPLALPLATLIASLMTLGGMGEFNELLAIKAAGIPLGRTLKPLIYVSFVISIGAFFISNNLIPVAWNNIYTLLYDISKTKDEIKIPTGTFYNGIEGYTIRISDRNDKSGMMYDVMVYNHTSGKGNVSLAVADSGSLKSTPDKTALIFILHNGTSYEETNTKKYRDTSYVLQRVDFGRQELIIPLENYSFQKSEKERYGNEIMAKNLHLLRKDRDSLGTLYDNLFERQKTRLIYSSDLNYAYQLDTAKNKGYTKVYSIDSLYTWKSLYDELEGVNSAISKLDTPVSTLQSFGREANQYTSFLRRIDIESFRKFTLSIACFVFFFIGAPLGAIIRKGGLGTPVIVSALFFVLYWVVDISGKKLARDGVISPALGTLISTGILLPIGIFLTYKSTKDSTLFNPDVFIAGIKAFFKKIDKKTCKRKRKQE